MKKTFIALSLLAMPTMMWAQGDNEINIDAQVRLYAVTPQKRTTGIVHRRAC